MDSYRAAGSSATRHKLAAFLRQRGIPVESSTRYYPPSDEDFYRAIVFAHYTGTLDRAMPKPAKLLRRIG